MSRDGSGNYSLPLPPVVTGTTIEATWANTTLDDIKTALTDSLSRSGNGGMSAQIKLIDGSVTVPSLGWASEANSGLYRAQATDVRMAVNGADKMRWSDANGVQIFSASWKSVPFSSVVKFDDAGAAVGGVFTQADADQLTAFCAGTEQGSHGQFKAYSATHATLPGVAEFGTLTEYARLYPTSGDFVFSSGTPTIKSATSDCETKIVGGQTKDSEPTLTLYGSDHGTNGWDATLTSNGWKLFNYDDSIDTLTLGFDVSNYCVLVLDGDATTPNYKFMVDNFTKYKFDLLSNNHDFTGDVRVRSPANFDGSISSQATTGSVAISGGNAAGSGAEIIVYGPSHGTYPNAVRIPNLPTSDPVVAGQLWNDSGTLKVSAG